MTQQPRIAAGSLNFLEIPSGMLDGDNNFRGIAAREIEEETGIKIPSEEAIDLIELALRDSRVKGPVRNAMYPSPGASDEFIPILLWEKELDRQTIENLRGKLTGQSTQGEIVTLRVCDYDVLWREGARDAKSMTAWALYEGLSRAGVLQDEVEKRKASRGRSSHI
ncbi:hypothetical protein E8E12_003821 [Didymella heteroderae]|uniref:Nudix hydrolase domain-containing protein n=1 Tax=Didymella heteroderae TaxID=1769908 RepID=A0A9P4WLD3_9PLEO|nr:hypothetical protein E8E12_003821 [Didymella heteroderae]